MSWHYCPGPLRGQNTEDRLTKSLPECGGSCTVSKISSASLAGSLGPQAGWLIGQASLSPLRAAAMEGGSFPEEIWFREEEIRNGFAPGLNQEGPEQGSEPKTINYFSLPQTGEKKENASRPDGARPVFAGSPTNRALCEDWRECPALTQGA